MPVIPAPTAPTHSLDGTSFTPLATPTRGDSEDTSVWRVTMEPGTTPTPHALTRQEVFVVLRGTADVTIDGQPARARCGDVIVVPKEVPFGLGNANDEPLELLCCLPVGGQARLADGSLITPPWAQ